jgi:hypothetical protein
MLASNPTGVAVQLVKWYQCMDFYCQLINRHNIQIFNVIPLDSYVISGPWSAGSSTPGHTLQWATIFFHIISYLSKFPEEIFLPQNVCFDSVLISSTIFLWNIFIIKKSENYSKISISLRVKESFLLSDLRGNLIFLTCSKHIQVPSFMKFRSCVLTDRQTWRSFSSLIAISRT